MRPGVPALFLVGPGGDDPLPQIEQAGRHFGVQVRSLSLGAGQETAAREALAAAAASGQWLVLQNLHLVPRWLPALARAVQALADAAAAPAGDGSSGITAQGGPLAMLSPVSMGASPMPSATTPSTPSGMLPRGEPDATAAAPVVAPGFRLFLTAEANAVSGRGQGSRLPRTLVRSVVLVTSEVSTGFGDALRSAMEGTGLLMAAAEAAVASAAGPGALLPHTSHQGGSSTTRPGTGVEPGGASELEVGSKAAFPGWARVKFVLGWYHACMLGRRSLGIHVCVVSVAPKLASRHTTPAHAL